MEHLPYPPNAHWPPVSIPCFLDARTSRYDRQGFLDFPIRCGWQTEQLQWFQCETQQAAARAQSWLWFGLIQEVFGASIEEAQFVKRDHQGAAVLSTRQHNTLLPRWSGKIIWRLVRGCANVMLGLVAMIASIGFLSVIDESKYGSLLSVSPRLTAKAKIALQNTERELLRLEAHHSSSEDVGLTCLAIRALLWSLRNAAANTNGQVMTRGYMELSVGSYILEVLLERGYCPHAVNNFSTYCSVATLHYLSAFKNDPHTHQYCTKSSCVAYIVVDESQYVTKHLTETCHCDMVRADQAEMIKIIQDGKIPIIDGKIDNGTVTLNVRPISSNVPYIAISHSWSGGLGNPFENALPTCQLKSILDQLQTIIPSTRNTIISPSLITALFKGLTAQNDNNQSFSQVFWLDTLCIPTWSQETESLRTQVITRMDQIYADAQHVVVMDPALRALPNNTTSELFLASVAISSWMTRCWTYLEGRLAQTLLVAIQGEVRDMFGPCFATASNISQWLWNMRTWDDTVQMKREITAGIYRMMPLKDVTVDSSGSELEHFVQCWNELSGRTTSRPADRLIILALMRDLSVFEMQQLGTVEHKLCAILRTQPQLPLTFLFEISTNARGVRPAVYDSWVPQGLSGRASATYGWLRRAFNSHTNDHGYIMEYKRDQVRVFRFRPTANLDIFDVLVNNPGYQQCRLRIKTTVQPSPNDHAQNSGLDQHPSDLILIITRTQNESHGQGCLLTIVDENSSCLHLQHICPLKYSVVTSEQPIDTSDIEVLPLANPVPDTIQLQLETDWSQWPALHYNRSASAKLSTSHENPVHIFISLLFIFEMSLCVIVAGMIIMVFPTVNSLANGFWSGKTTPAEWIAWGLCIFIIVARVHILLHFELPALNQKLSTLEYQKWSASLPYGSQPTTTVPKRPLLHLYQYHSWYVVIALILTSTTLIVIGVLIDNPQLYDLAILGGYLLFCSTTRISVELFWRYPSLQIYKSRFTNWITSNPRGGQGPLMFTGVLGYLQIDSWWTLLVRPRRFVHKTADLTVAFEDPMYLPEDFVRRGGSYVSTVTSVTAKRRQDTLMI